MLSRPGQVQGRETPWPAAPAPLSRGSVPGGGEVIFLGGGASSCQLRALLCELKLFLLLLPSRDLLK